MCRFFFLQRSALRSDLQPIYEAIPELERAQTECDAEGYSSKWGPYAELRHAATLLPVLNAMWGTKGDITEHLIIHVLTEIAAATDAQRLQDQMNRAIQRYGSKTP